MEKLAKCVDRALKSNQSSRPQHLQIFENLDRRIAPNFKFRIFMPGYLRHIE